ncbi:MULTISPECIES: TIGR03619 family F420-dependent LLM class oxidoreductase [Rhodococcus]|uniref:TIGR03619 family F420-dependent LLM class oxidoreductase n=1 Tax=Rhodococcus rhodochrous TaxID=1829 RepID=A0AA46X180_RHORH|nr:MULTISPECIES: TIGR03619 family F420-dependent LLM class oxidoreductase [Rhodococcus]MBF4481521.1 TIGR03619 family F420-dependent LLM class oxidoreductase [Rhodococcus rhodochrous]MCB8911685.1 TIGR03619 family F420-dependent LLM class oxidoreductase [Rhodococcus rhodochrous]MCD2095875.1 TIGR03619 family F420-dependent LLM class oxidoreductase [Rhodococcus rhodochrous]MCD2119691.1 TIGR03619 family F420-dependent LLM class oxidoreductase [Rhodococcus rhodochrous]MCQ4135243.1 TIGR03619 family F
MPTIGLCTYGITPLEALELARAADELGFDALWLGEHVLHPAAYTSDHPSTGTRQHHSGPIVDDTTELTDPLALHASIAAVTERLKLGTAVYVTALRHPLHTARTTITLQELSGGRLLFGVGAGWLAEEFAALDVPFAGRFSRTDECVEILRKAWGGESFSHEGAHYRFDEVRSHPRPVAVPVVYGGNGPRALARAARLGDAWISSGTPTFEEAVELVDVLRRHRVEAGGNAEFPCYVRVEVTEATTAADLECYRDRGLDDLVVWADAGWKGATVAERRENLAALAGRLGVRSPAYLR